MSKGMRTVVLALMLAIGRNSGNMAKAELIAVDDAVFGIGSITRDTGTGLDWLDVTASQQGRSFIDVNSQFGVGGDFEGFHHASLAEVSQFFTNAGLQVGLFRIAANALPALNLLSLWGTTHVNPDNLLSLALTSDPASSGFHFTAALAWCIGCFPMAAGEAGGLAAAPSSTFGESDTRTLNPLSHALIRETPTPVPEPATSILLLSGLFMVGLAKGKLARGKRRSSRL